MLLESSGEVARMYRDPRKQRVASRPPVSFLGEAMSAPFATPPSFRGDAQRWFSMENVDVHGFRDPPSAAPE
jgi:hypothetical protein